MLGVKNISEKSVGLSMKKLDATEMEKIYGASGVDTRTHPTVVVVSRASSKFCVTVAASALLSYNMNKC
ncbi:lichenicidin A2 family type 2 lantibiotic [Bacillus thuringiensis]|uniref:lichenicidin A2 family type 2 lantibiotic n=1 Tax=Bacillus thuringiensis TaxID=1428 RepID=UPI003BF8609D